MDRRLSFAGYKMLAYITILFWWASNVMDNIIRPLWLSTNIFLNLSFTTRTIIDGLRYHIENCEIIDMYYKKTSSGVLILILHRDNFVYNKYIRPSCSTYQLQPYVLNWLSIWSLGSKNCIKRGKLITSSYWYCN